MTEYITNHLNIIFLSAPTAVAVVIPIIAAIIFCGLGIFLGYYYFKKKNTESEKKLKQKIIDIETKNIQIAAKAKKDLKNELVQLRKNFQKECDTTQKKLSDYELILAKRESTLLARTEKLDKYFQELSHRKDNMRLLEEKYQEKIELAMQELEKNAGLTQIEAKKILLKEIKDNLTLEAAQVLKNYENEIKLKSREISTGILLDSMNRFSSDLVSERVITQVKLPSEEMKGRIIGKEGRNVRAFELASGVDLIIDDSPEVIQVSSFNPVRREIAVRALNKLIKDGRIQPIKIEEALKQEAKILEAAMLEIGKEVTEELNIYGIDPKLVYYIGRLKFRTSYGQNALLHSVEVAKLAGYIATELHADVNLAKRAGLLHDIGKAIDYELEGTHVSLGVKIAKKFGESKDVYNVIAEHHGDVPISNIYTTIVMIADTLSASRPGARNNSYEEFIQRMEAIEEICTKIPEVKQAYALQAGRQIRVMVNPGKANDLRTREIAKLIKEEISNAKFAVPGEIVINVIRQFNVKTKIS